MGRRRPNEAVIQGVAAVLTVTVPTYGIAWVQTLIPGMPETLAAFISSFTIAVGLFSLWALSTARATLSVEWCEDEHPTVELEQVIVHIDQSSRQSQAFWVRVTHVDSEGFGAFALWLGAKVGFQLRVEALHSSMVFVPEADQRAGQPVIAFARAGCSLHVALRPKKPAPGATWGSVKTRFHGLQQRPTENYTLDYSVTGSTRVAKWCGKLISVVPTARRLDENWR